MTKSTKEIPVTFRENIESKCKKIALYTIQAVTVLNKTQAAYVLGDNAIKSASKVGVLYRKTAYAKHEDFIMRTEAVLSQCDDTLYWLELIEHCGVGSKGITEMAAKEAKDVITSLTTVLNKVREVEEYR